MGVESKQPGPVTPWSIKRLHVILTKNGFFAERQIQNIAAAGDQMPSVAT